MTTQTFRKKPIDHNLVPLESKLKYVFIDILSRNTWLPAM